jgi:hypothetical protein
MLIAAFSRRVGADGLASRADLDSHSTPAYYPPRANPPLIARARLAPMLRPRTTLRRRGSNG